MRLLTHDELENDGIVMERNSVAYVDMDINPKASPTRQVKICDLARVKSEVFGINLIL